MNIQPQQSAFEGESIELGVGTPADLLELDAHSQPELDNLREFGAGMESL